MSERRLQKRRTGTVSTVASCRPLGSSEDLLVDLVEELLDVSLDVAGEEPPAVTFERLSVWPDEELLKVPGHVVPAHWAPHDQLGVVHQGRGVVAGGWKPFPKEHEQGMGILPVHIHLLQKLKLWLEAISRTDVLERLDDFFILAVLLQVDH